MPEWDVISLFLIASLALNLTPGPDMLYVGAQSVSGGVRCGIAASGGISVGGFLHSLLAALGVSALLATEPFLFDMLRYIGASYLIWLGLSSFWAPPVQVQTVSAVPLAKVFQRGVVTNLLNPKVAMFVLAFLPQFADPVLGPVWIQILIFGAMFSVGGGIILCAVASGGGWLGQALQRHSQMGRVPNWISGSVMIGLAVKLLTDETAVARPH